MADNRPIGAKIERISDKDIAKDCDRVSFVFGFWFSGLSVFITLPGPDLELLDKRISTHLVTISEEAKRQKKKKSRENETKKKKHTKESQDPVHRLMPSLLTPRQLTRFSWPLSEPTLSPRSTSHTCRRVNRSRSSGEFR